MMASSYGARFHMHGKLLRGQRRSRKDTGRYWQRQTVLISFLSDIMMDVYWRGIAICVIRPRT